VRPKSKDAGRQRRLQKNAEDVTKKKTAETEATKKDPSEITVVAIGASAGGIEAVTELLSYLPANTGLAFVLIQHLDPTHHSLLTELLSRKTAMAVHEVKHGMTVEANAIYVIPPNVTMTISDQTLQLSPRTEVRGLHLPVDEFMRALAEQKGNRAIGVILSGSGSDGTLGIEEIHAHGGMTFAQDEESAKYSGMPRSAVAAGRVDYVLTPRKIAEELLRIAKHPYTARPKLPEPQEIVPAAEGNLGSLFEILRKATSVDFTHYRQTTILRRIQRRMVVHKMDHIAEYVKYVKANSGETRTLYQDILINVTSFFRDPKVFEQLKSEILPAILRTRPQERGIRIWTPGCASGEETYSVAIALMEYLGEKASYPPIQFFGTDVSEVSVAKARSGTYPENITMDVSRERIGRFFTKTVEGYRLSKSIRDMCIFAVHNVLNDPPFSQMDLICCRNLLIYMEPVLQSRVLSLFHYALRSTGFLVLGASEGLGMASGLFATEDRSQKIFTKKATAVRQAVTFSLAGASERNAHGLTKHASKGLEEGWSFGEAQKEFDKRLLTQFAPATVFVNGDMEVIHIRGNVNRYLTLATGRASLSLLKMAREGLAVELRNAIGRAKREKSPVSRKNLLVRQETEQGEGIKAAEGLKFITTSIEVLPITVGNLREMYFMVVFHEAPQEPEVKSIGRSKAAAKEAVEDASRRAKLEMELAATKEYLESVIETQEATNEELQSANEEILSSNEELQSTNEEMETAKEELQSANEELTTVNDELRSRNQEMTQLNNDLLNLLASIDIAVLMVGSEMTLRRFTPKAQKLLGLIPADIGRPLASMRPTIAMTGLQEMAAQVMQDFRTVETELTDGEGIHYQLKILPYRTLDNKIDGVVITVVDLAPEQRKWVERASDGRVAHRAPSKQRVS
jgi:two-component system CheB/CheR fusion protein